MPKDEDLFPLAATALRRLEKLTSINKKISSETINAIKQLKETHGLSLKVFHQCRAEDGKIVKMDVKVGARVLFGKWSGTEVKIDGKEYSRMKESAIMGITKSK